MRLSLALLLSFSLSSLGLSAQSENVYTRFDLGYSFAYLDYSRLAEVTTTTVKLPNISFGIYMESGLRFEGLEFVFGFGTQLAQYNEEQSLALVQGRFGLAYNFQLSETWRLRPNLSLVMEVGEFQAVVPNFSPQTGASGNFNNYIMEQNFLMLQPEFIWQPKSKMLSAFPDWIVIKPSYGAPLGKGELRWRGGDGKNLLSQTLWEYRVMFDIGFGWKF